MPTHPLSLLNSFLHTHLATPHIRSLSHTHPHLHTRSTPTHPSSHLSTSTSFLSTSIYSHQSKYPSRPCSSTVLPTVTHSSLPLKNSQPLLTHLTHSSPTPTPTSVYPSLTLLFSIYLFSHSPTRTHTLVPTHPHVLSLPNTLHTLTSSPTATPHTPLILPTTAMHPDHLFLHASHILRAETSPHPFHHPTPSPQTSPITRHHFLRQSTLFFPCSSVLLRFPLLPPL